MPTTSRGKTACTHILWTTTIAACSFAQAANAEDANRSFTRAGDHTIACYYFPNYHVDPRNEKQHGPGWSEWELVRRAEPKFEGHQQPKIPLWGYTDEADPAVMAKKIDAAASHGIDAFIFDWYWYDDGPFLERGLEKGFLHAPNNARLKFAVMWANHDWVDIHPAKAGYVPLQYPGKVTPETFDRITDHVIRTYFRHPSHWMIDGKPYFSVYELFRLVEGFGGIDATAKALQRFREKTKAAGFPGLHLNAVAAGIQILPGEKDVKNPAELVSRLGFDSVTSYVWVHHVGFPTFPTTPYTFMMDKAAEHWAKATAEFRIPYHPNVTMGWDPSPRTVQSDKFANQGYPFMATLSGNTPAAFKTALTRAKAFLDNHAETQKILTINAWNEWTEGSYLEPDTIHGMAYLEAIRDVFGLRASYQPQRGLGSGRTGD
ncbi:MAG: glycoside hydrolase family 99-like domain-containing protein [Phycisphaerae bacterium]|nr:glycoside hydrolase family 99-like domain-containing protein [Phycisphaerae bacterium]